MWLGIIWIGMLAGFGVDLPSFLRQSPPAAQVVLVHAGVFVAWLLLVTAMVRGWGYGG